MGSIRAMTLGGILSLTLFGSAFVPAFAQEHKTANGLEETILKLEQQWEDALTQSDTGALERLYDERLIYTHSNGKVDTKATYIQAIKSGATRYESMKRDDIKVTAYGQTALVTCHWQVHVLAQGNKIDTNARYLHVFIQQRDGWKLVAHQSTRITP
jgi:ketosteroid isomerase-like protein